MAPPRLSARDDRGQILLLTALSMTVILGIAALSLDASFMYDKRNRLHAAADGAAKSGALEVRRLSTVSQSALEAFADQQVAAHGFSPSRSGGTTTVTVLHPPTGSASYNGNVNYVEVVTSEPTSTFLGVVLGRANMTPAVRAVAGTSNGPNCIVILGGALTLANGVRLTMPGCSIADGGTMTMGNGAIVDAASTAVTIGPCPVGGISNCTSAAPYPSDPLGSLAAPTPAPAHTCTTQFNITSDITISTTDVNKYYCGMKIDNAVVTFNAGVYYIAGPVTNKNGGSDATLQGSGVMFYLAGGTPGGSFWFDSNHVEMDLRAPTSGPYTGVLFYQDRSNTNPAQLSKNGNGGGMTLSGALYFPSASLSMKNGNDVGLTNNCSLIVAQSLSLNNNSVLSNTCSGYGGSPLLTVSVAE
ncbi:MAG: Tad domain-containing protein [Vicinamibacterales bacterium]